MNKIYEYVLTDRNTITVLRLDDATVYCDVTDEIKMKKMMTEMESTEPFENA